MKKLIVSATLTIVGSILASAGFVGMAISSSSSSNGNIGSLGIIGLILGVVMMLGGLLEFCTIKDDDTKKNQDNQN